MSNRALIEHIEAINEQTGTNLVTIPDHWADYDVYTPEEMDRYLLETDYRELYKDVYGVRSKLSLKDMSDEMLKQAVDELVEKLDQEFEDQRDKINEKLDQMDREWSIAQLQAETEFDGEFDDIAEEFDDTTVTKKRFN